MTLKRGVAGDLELFEWWQSIRDGQLLRRKVTITLLDEHRQAVQRWVLRDTPGRRSSTTVFDALGNEVVIETLELAHEGFETE